MLQKVHIPIQINENELLFHSIHMNYPKWFKDLSVRSETVKIPEGTSSSALVLAMTFWT